MAIRTTGVRYDVIARDSASRVFDSIGRSALRTDGQLGKLAKTSIAAGAAMVGGIGAGMVVSAEKAIHFESTMKKVQTQAGATAKDVGVLSGQVLQLGKTTQQGPQALADSLYHLKSVGMDNVDAMKALKVASDLAAVGGADLESTTNALAGAWRSGIKGAETFATTASTVNAVIGAGNMRMADFTAAIGTGILPSAKSFGLSLNQVGAALALMTDEGIPAVDAATRLRMSFSLLGAPSKAADKQLKSIGLTGLDLATAMRGPQGIIGAVSLLKDHLDKSGLSAARQSQVLSRAFGGGRSSSGILTLLNNLDVLRKKQDQVNSSMGKYAPAVEAQRKTASAQLAILKSNLDVFAIEAGTKLLPPITSFVSYVNKTGLPAVGRFSHALLGMVPVAQIEAGFATANGLIGDFLGALLPKKQPVIGIQPKVVLPKSMPQSLLDFGVQSPTITPKVTLPKSMPQSLLNYGFAPHVVAPPKSQATQFGEQVRRLLSGGIGDAVKGIKWGDLGSRIGAGLGTAIGWVGKHTADLTKKLGGVLAKIDWVKVGESLGATAIPLAIGIVKSLFSPLFSLKFWEDHWLDTIIAVVSVIPAGRIMGPLGKVFEKIPVLKLFAPVLRGITGLGKPVEGAVGGVMKFFGSSMWKGIARVFPEGTAKLEEEAGIFTTRIGVWGIDLGRAGMRALRGLGNGIKTGFEWVIAKIGEGIGWLLKPFADAGSWLVKTGGELLSGLRSGISGGASRIGGWVSDHVVSPVRGTFTGAGSWLYERGAALVNGLKNGVVSIGKGIGGWVKTNVIDHVTGAFGAAKTWLTGPGGDIVSGLVSGTWNWLKKKGNDFASWAGKIKDKVVGAIVDVFKIGSPSKVMMQYGGWIVAGLQHGMLSGKKVLHAAVKGLFHSPLAAAENLAKNGVQLPVKWAAKLLSAKTPQSADIPVSPNVASAQAYASSLVAQLWPKNAAAQMNALRSLWNAESGWRANAENMSSGAYGIPQSLPASKMASAGADWRTNAATQIRWGLDYIRGRYGDPATAWESWNAHKPHWYAKGGLAQFGETAWVGEQGPELMQVTSKGTRIFSNPDSMALAKANGIQLPGYAAGTVAAGRVAAATRDVRRAEDALTAWRNREARAHSRAQRYADKLQIEAAQHRLTAARAELAAAKKLATASNTVANTLQNGFLKSLETGSAAAIASAIKSMNTKLQAAGLGSMVAANLRTASTLEGLANRRASVQGQIAAAQQYAATQSGNLGQYLAVGSTSAVSARGLISQMRMQQATAGRFTDEVTALRRRGLDKSLLGQLADSGPGSQLAYALAHASSSDIAQLNKLAASQSKLTVSFGQSMANAMYDSGAQAGKGFLSGLQAQEKALQKEMDRLADGMVKTIEHKLGIHSPSTVARDRLGKNFALGVALGVRIHAPRATAEAQRMADTMAAVRARTGGVSGGMGGGTHVDRSRTITINLNGADQSSAEQRADLLRHMQQLA